jgi:hypothetical protein
VNLLYSGELQLKLQLSGPCDPLLRRPFRAGVNLCVSRSAVIRVVLE